MRFLLFFLFPIAVLADSLKIGVVDTGVELKHPFLEKHLEIINEKEQVLLSVKESKLEDLNGHGTHVAGIIVKNMPKKISYKIIPFKNITGEDQDTCLDDMGIESIIDFSIKHNIKFLNFSQVMPEYSDKVLKALKKAEQNNILIVTASGNKTKLGENYVTALDLTGLHNAFQKIKLDDPSRVQINAYPCAYGLKNIICVGNYMKVGKKPIRVPDSNYGKDHVHMMAYGEDVESSCLLNSFCKMSGSSMSTPRVLVELTKIWTKKPSLTPEEVIDTLLKRLPKDAKLKNLTKTGAFLD